MTSKVLIVTNSYERVFNPQPVKICNVDGEVLEKEFKKDPNLKVQLSQNVYTAKELLDVLDNFVTESNNDPIDLDTVFFAFSGHGGHGKEKPLGYKETEDDFIVTDDGKGHILKKEIRKKISEIKSKHKVFVFNCCRGRSKMGILQSRPKKDIEEEMTNSDLTNSWILHASTPHHVAWALPHGPHKTTVFIWMFLEALEDMKRDGKAFTTIDELINKKYASYQPPPNANWVKTRDQAEVDEMIAKIRNMGCHLEKIKVISMDFKLPF